MILSDPSSQRQQRTALQWNLEPPIRLRLWGSLPRGPVTKALTRGVIEGHPNAVAGIILGPATHPKKLSKKIIIHEPPRTIPKAICHHFGFDMIWLFFFGIRLYSQIHKFRITLQETKILMYWCVKQKCWFFTSMFVYWAQQPLRKHTDIKYKPSDPSANLSS